MPGFKVLNVAEKNDAAKNIANIMSGGRGLGDNCQILAVRSDNCQWGQLSVGTTVSGDNCQWRQLSVETTVSGDNCQWANCQWKL